MQTLIDKDEFTIFVAEGKRHTGGKERELGAMWTEQPEFALHKGWYEGLLWEEGKDRVFLTTLLENEKLPHGTGLAVVADEKFQVYYYNSEGNKIQILGQRPPQQLDSKVFLGPRPDRRAPLIFGSETTVKLVIAKGDQELKLVQITKR